MSYSVSDLYQLAKRMEKTLDLSAKANIFEAVKKNTDNFTKNIPVGCNKAIETIKSIGMQAKLFLDIEKKRNSTPKDQISLEDSKKIIKDENNLTKITFKFISDNASQIIVGVSSVALAILAAFYYRVPYPVRIGAISGSLAFFGAKSYFMKGSNDEDIDELGNPLDLTAKRKIAILNSKSLAEHQNPKSLSIVIEALSSLLLNPKNRKVIDWEDKGNKLYEKVIDQLKLKKDQHLDIEDIINTKSLNPEIILGSKLHPENDLNILKNEADLNKLIDAFIDISNDNPIGGIITRFLNTYAVFYNPENYQFLFLDANNESFSPQIFRSKNALVKHLMTIKPIDNDFIKKPEVYKNKSKLYLNPNACAIIILRKKESVKEGKLEIKEKEEEEKAKPPISIKTEEERLAEAEEKALAHALNLSIMSSSTDSSGGLKREERVLRKSTEYDELLARDLQEKELRHSSSSSSGYGLEGDFDDDDDELKRVLRKSLSDK